MDNFWSSLDWGTLLTTVWTVILLPLATVIGTKINAIAKANKIEKYTNMLYTAAETVVKDLQDSVVKDIKGTDEWTDEKIEEIRQKAIDKAIASMSYEGYKILKEANSDFDTWVDSIIRAKLYNVIFSINREPTKLIIK